MSNMKKEAIILAEVIKKIYTSKNIKAFRLANALGMEQSSFSRRMTYDATIDFAFLLKFCEVMELKISLLMQIYEDVYDKTSSLVFNRRLPSAFVSVIDELPTKYPEITAPLKYNLLKTTAVLLQKNKMFVVRIKHPSIKIQNQVIEMINSESALTTNIKPYFTQISARHIEIGFKINNESNIVDWVEELNSKI